MDECKPLHSGKKIGVKTRNGEKVESDDITDVKRSNTLAAKLKERNTKHSVAASVEDQFAQGQGGC